MSEEHTGRGLPGVWLALDTSTSSMTIALFQQGRVIAEYGDHADRNHSIRLVPAIRELVASAGLRMSELGGIAAGNGPGSYTGIRIAATVAKTLAWSLNIPLIGVSSLEALAYGAARCAGGGELWVAPVMDARRGKVYTGLYRMSGGQWRREAGDGVRMLDDWLQELAAPMIGEREAVVLLPGDLSGIGDYVKELCAAQQSDSGISWRPEHCVLQAADVARLAIMYGMDAAVTDAHAYIPNYTQLSEPEKKWAKTKELRQN